MDRSLRRNVALIVGAMLFLLAIMTLMSQRGSGDTAQAAAASPYGALTIRYSPTKSMSFDIRGHEWELSGDFDPGGGTGGGSGRANFSQFSIVKNISANSPELARTVALQPHIDKVTVKIYKPGTSQAAGTYTLEDVLIARIHESPGGNALEEVSFVYDHIRWVQGQNVFCFDVSLYTTCP